MPASSSSSSNGHNYKLLSYVLFAILVVLVTSMLCTAAVVYNRKMFLMKLLFNNSLQRSLHVATSNRLMCSLADTHCHFRADPSVQPPVVTATKQKQSRRRVSLRARFSLDAAKFAAQVVAMLEQAAVQRVDPTPRDDTEVLAVLSGGTRTNKNKNIGWVLRVRGGGSDQIWVAFRGTQTNAEWQQDFKMEQVALPRQQHAENDDDGDGDIMAHRGFWEAYLEVRDELRQTLHRHASPEKTTLFITGHSLGAAIAVLALLDWIVLSPPAATPLTDVRCYVFGAPRVGNAALVDAIMSRYRRRRASSPLREFHVISNDEDIVPNIPLAVQPNLETPEMPWLYAQFPMKRFSTNWGSWTFNHTLPVHISFLNDLQDGGGDDDDDDDATALKKIN